MPWRRHLTCQLRTALNSALMPRAGQTMVSRNSNFTKEENARVSRSGRWSGGRCPGSPCLLRRMSISSAMSCARLPAPQPPPQPIKCVYMLLHPNAVMQAH